ncbi:hypothetical protein G6F62_014654 [Rhizopus arrhizus]|nr:hypothetical protein G6F62_014654 [Rhizopus arrhizus]
MLEQGGYPVDIEPDPLPAVALAPAARVACGQLCDAIKHFAVPPAEAETPEEGAAATPKAGPPVRPCSAICCTRCWTGPASTPP